MSIDHFEKIYLSSYLADALVDSSAVFAGAAALLTTELTKYRALASIEAFNHSYEKLVAALGNSYKIITNLTSPTVFEHAVSKITELTSSLDIDFSLPETVSQLSESLHSLCKSCSIYENLSCLAQSEFNAEDLASVLTQGITFEQDSVILTDDAVETLSDFLPEVDTVPADVVKNKMPVRDFIFNYLLPLLAFVLPIILDSYFHKLDSVDAQQQQTQNAIYQEQHFDFESQLLEEERIQTEEAIKQSEYLQQLIDLLSSPEVLEALQEASPETPSVPEEPSSVPEEPSSAPDTGTTLDSPDVPDSNE